MNQSINQSIQLIDCWLDWLIGLTNWLIDWFSYPAATYVGLVMVMVSNTTVLALVMVLPLLLPLLVLSTRLTVCQELLSHNSYGCKCSITFFQKVKLQVYEAWQFQCRHQLGRTVRFSSNFKMLSWREFHRVTQRVVNWLLQNVLNKLSRFWSDACIQIRAFYHQCMIHAGKKTGSAVAKYWVIDRLVGSCIISVSNWEYQNTKLQLVQRIVKGNDLQHCNLKCNWKLLNYWGVTVTLD